MRKKKVQKNQINHHCLNLESLFLLITVFLIGFGQLQRIQLTRTIAFYGHDLFLILFVIVSFFKLLSKKDTLSNFFQRWKLLIIFGLWSLGGLLINQAIIGFNVVPWLYLSRLVLYLLFGLSIKNYLQNNNCSSKWMKLLFCILLGMVVIIGFFQYLLIPDLRFTSASGWDVHYFRLAGGMLDPNFTGMILINLLITIVFLFKKRCKKVLYFGILVTTAIALTYSRSAYLSMLMVVLASYWLKTKAVFQRDKMLSFFLVGLIVMLPFLPKPGGLGVQLTRTETISSRAEVNESILEQLNLQQLLLGRGFFTPSINTKITDRVVHANFPDNFFIFLLSSTGVIGLSLIVIFLFQEVKRGLINKNPGLILLLVGTLVHSMFNLTILEPINLLVLLICLNALKIKNEPASSA